MAKRSLQANTPVDMTTWLAKTPAVLQAWYDGSEAGHALASVVFGGVSPSGKRCLQSAPEPP